MSRLLHIGVTDGDERLESFRTLFSNSIALLSILVLSFYMFMFIKNGHHETAFMYFCLGVLAVLPVYSNHLGLRFVGRLLVILIAASSIFGAVLMIGFES